jgi:D-arabinose 1-dehydrogenase-like Zn-dependent alcohol dehydrogenase
MGNKFPIVPGHEVIGRVAKVGEGVQSFEENQRVGISWHGGHCFSCDGCRGGDFQACKNARITGIHHDGGYGEYMVSPAEALVKMPEDLPAEDAAPLMCAGVTVFNALKKANGQPGDVCVVQGLGGLGHLAVQFAVKMGFLTVGVSSGGDKAELAKKLGAHQYIDASKQDTIAEILKLGGAKVIIPTAPSSKAISDIPPALAMDGHVVVVGIDMKPIEVSPLHLITKRAVLTGSLTGTPVEVEHCVQFASNLGVHSMVEVYPLDKAAEAFERMLSNKARFRVVLKM